MEVKRLKVEEFQLVDELDAKDSEDTETSPPSRIEIISMDPLEMEMDFIGYDISLINAYRRIILAEVATMALEKVYMYNNTSIVQDEVLAHRIGLVPLKVDPRFFEFRNEDETEWGAQDSLKYELKVRCTRNKEAAANETNPDVLFVNRKVVSSSLKWIPLGNQPDIFQEANMQPLHPDILLAKMNSGHEINLEAYAVKGIGSDHAKFQPGLCWYRMLPEVELTREVEGKQAELLQTCFSPGVIDIVTSANGKQIAKVNNARNDSCSRNVFQHDNIKDSVKLTRKMDHVIYHLTGCLDMEHVDWSFRGFLVIATTVLAAMGDRLTNPSDYCCNTLPPPSSLSFFPHAFVHNLEVIPIGQMALIFNMHHACNKELEAQITVPPQ